MAKKPCFITWGQSNMEGAGALTSVDAATISRWTGKTIAELGTFPANVICPGVNVFQLTLPYQSLLTAKTGTADSATSSSLTDTGAFSGSDDEKIVVIMGGTGLTQVRRISSVSGSDTINVATNWATTPDTTSRYWVGHGGVLTSASTTTLTVSTASWPTFTGAVIVMLNGTYAGVQRGISSNTGDTITLDEPLAGTPAVGDAFVIYDSGTRSVATMTGAFRPLQFYYDTSLVRATGYEYPSFRSIPIWAPAAESTSFGPPVELSWQLSQDFEEPIYWIHLAIPSAYSSRYLGTLPNPEHAWYRNDEHNDWHPNSVGDIFSVWSSLLALANASVGGDGLAVKAIFGVEGESDSVTDERTAVFPTNMKLILDRMREVIGELGMCDVSPDRIPQLMGGVNTAYWPNADATNATLQSFEDDDSYRAFVDTAGMVQNGVDGAHWGTSGCIEFGKRFADAYRALRTRFDDANVPTGRWTLAQLRSEVKAIYEGNAVSTNATTARVTAALNMAQRLILNKLGKRAWFLRRTEPSVLSSDYYSTITLPAKVGTLLRLRESSRPENEISFRVVTRTGSGKQQIIPRIPLSGTYMLDFIESPREMENETDVTVIPPEHVDLMVYIAAEELARPGGNAQLIPLLAAKVAEQWTALWKGVTMREQSGKWPAAYTDMTANPLGFSEGPWMDQDKDF